MAQLKAGSTVGGASILTGSVNGSVVDTLGVQTLSNKTLTSPVINGGSQNTVTINTSTISSSTINTSTLNAPSIDGAILTSTTSVEEILEKVNLVGTAYAAGANIDLKTGALFYNTATATSNPTFNFRGDGSSTLSSVLAVGQSITCTLLITNGVTPYYPTAYNIDGSAITAKWAGGTAPTSGNASAIDVYTFTIIKTAATPSYIILASQTQYK